MLALAGLSLNCGCIVIGMGSVYYLPEDLGASNRIFRVPLVDLTKSSVPQESRSLP